MWLFRTKYFFILGTVLISGALVWVVAALLQSPHDVRPIPAPAAVVLSEPRDSYPAIIAEEEQKDRTAFIERVRQTYVPPKESESEVPQTPLEYEAPAMVTPQAPVDAFLLPLPASSSLPVAEYILASSTATEAPAEFGDSMIAPPGTTTPSAQAPRPQVGAPTTTDEVRDQEINEEM